VEVMMRKPEPPKLVEVRDGLPFFDCLLLALPFVLVFAFGFAAGAAL